MSGFIQTPSMGDIDSLQKRVRRLERIVDDLLTILKADGTIEIQGPTKKGHITESGD